MVTDNTQSRTSRLIARLFGRTGFRGPVMTLLSGSGVSLGLAYLAQLVLARLYPPEAFGVSDYFVMVVTVLLALSSLRFEDAVMTPSGEREARRVLLLAFLLTATFVVLLAVAALWAPQVTALLGVPELARWFWLLPAGLFSMKSAKLLELWLARQKEFRTITAGQVTGTSATVGTRIGAGVIPPAAGAGGLIGGFVLGQTANLAVLIPRALSAGRTRSSDHAGEERASLWSLVVRYRRYALFSTPAAVLNAAFSRLPTILLPLFFSWTVVGYYGRAYVALAVPLGLVGSAVAQVFFVHAGEAMRAGTLNRLTAQVHGRLVMLGLLPTVAVMLAGPALFEVLFGSPWRPAGEYLRYVAPWLFLAAVASPLTRVFDVLERQRSDLSTSTIMFALQAAALLVGGRTGDVALTLLLLGVTGVLARTMHLSVLLRISGVSLRNALWPYARYGVYALLPGIAIAAVSATGSNVATLGVVLLGLVGYYTAIAVRERLLSTSR